MAELFKIQGGGALRGKVEVRGSKNVSSKMMIASLLTEEPCVIENISLSADTLITKELCERVGSRAYFDEKNHRCFMETQKVTRSRVPELSGRNRIPVLALGPLLQRTGRAEVPVLGGCPIGHRPINFHVEALSKMGARIERRPNSYYAEAPQGLHGEEIEFPYPSVGATESVILAAALARGKTVIRNAAVEPEILNLIDMLKAMGAKIECSGETREISIEGASRLCGVKARSMADRNEAVSFAVAALATGGDIFMEGVEESYLKPFLEKVKEIGAFYGIRGGGIRFWGRPPYRATSLETSPHPGFMTDWQQPFTVLLTQSEGQSIIHETVYEDRLGYARDLERMGAKIEVREECGLNPCRFYGMGYRHSARISGPTILRGVELVMRDIRAGMAHIIAALAAEGESVISGVEHIDRGYEKIDERLRSLGAYIKRV